MVLWLQSLMMVDLCRSSSRISSVFSREWYMYVAEESASGGAVKLKCRIGGYANGQRSFGSPFQ